MIHILILTILLKVFLKFYVAILSDFVLLRFLFELLLDLSTQKAGQNIEFSIGFLSTLERKKSSMLGMKEG